jgi:hypothetical protein
MADKKNQIYFSISIYNLELTAFPVEEKGEICNYMYQKGIELLILSLPLSQISDI